VSSARSVEEVIWGSGLGRLPLFRFLLESRESRTTRTGISIRYGSNVLTVRGGAYTIELCNSTLLQPEAVGRGTSFLF